MRFSLLQCLYFSLLLLPWTWPASFHVYSLTSFLRPWSVLWGLSSEALFWLTQPLFSSPWWHHFWGDIFFTLSWSCFFPPFLWDFCLWFFPGDPSALKGVHSVSQLMADPRCWELLELSWWNLSAVLLDLASPFLRTFSLTLCPRPERHVCSETQTTVSLIKITSSTILLTNQPQNWLSG